MIKPPIPVNEQERLETLRAMQILDSSPEERYDRLTRLAQRLFNVPIVAISLIDENRQWFKSIQGLAATETSRDISFCGHAINGNDVMVVNDALKDHRFVDNPFVVQDPHIRFYAGYPIESQKMKMGTLCLIDKKPRELSGVELSLLQNLGRLVENEMAQSEAGFANDISGESEQRFFLRVLRYVMEFSRAMNYPMGMLIVHIPEAISALDGKPIIRDRMMVETAKLLGKTLRQSDIVGALGNDSFYAFLPKCDVLGAEIVTSRLNENFQDLKERLACSSEFDLRLGQLIWTPENSDTAEDMIKKGLKLLEEIRFEN